MAVDEVGDHWQEINEAVRAAVSRYMSNRTDTSFDESQLTEFEAELARFLGVGHVIAAASGTAAAAAVFLWTHRLGIKALSMPSHVFPGVAGAALLGAHELEFIGCHPDTLVPGRDSERASECAVYHFPWGATTATLALLRQSRVNVRISDLSHVLGLRDSSGTQVGMSDSTIGFSSLGAGKLLSGFEMGVILCDDDSLYDALLDIGGVRRKRKTGIPVNAIEMKLRPHPLAVAVASAQLRRLDDKLAGHINASRALAKRLEDLDGVEVVGGTDRQRTYWRLVLRIGPPRYEATLDTIIAELRDRGISASRLEYLEDAVELTNERASAYGVAVLRPSTPLADEYLCLPGYYDLGVKQAMMVADALHDALARQGMS